MLLLLVFLSDECGCHLARLVWQVHFIFSVANDVWHDLRVFVVGNGTLFDLGVGLLLLLLFLVSLEFIERA